MSELTPLQMFEAADTLERVSRHYGAFDPTQYEWSAARLRIEAEQLLWEVL